MVVDLCGDFPRARVDGHQTLLKHLQLGELVGHGGCREVRQRDDVVVIEIHGNVGAALIEELGPERVKELDQRRGGALARDGWCGASGGGGRARACHHVAADGANSVHRGHVAFSERRRILCWSADATWCGCAVRGSRSLTGRLSGAAGPASCHEMTSASRATFPLENTGGIFYVYRIHITLPLENMTRSNQHGRELHSLARWT